MRPRSLEVDGKRGHFPGNITHEGWKNLHSLGIWTNEIMDENQLEQAFRLVLKLASTNPYGKTEIKYQDSNPVTEANQPIVDSALVHQLICKWKEWCQQQPSNNWKGIGNDLSPFQIVQYLEAFRRQECVDIRSYNGVLQVYHTINMEGADLQDYQQRAHDMNHVLDLVRLKKYMHSHEVQRHKQQPATKNREGDPLRPNTSTYTSVLEALIDAGQISDALKLWNRILHTPKTHDNLRFGSAVFEKALQKCVHHPFLSPTKCVSLANAVISRMEKLHEKGLASQSPHVGHYTQLMQAYANSGHPQAGHFVLRLLKILQDKAKDGQSQMQPDTTAYHAVLHTFAKLAQVEPAEQLLAQLCSEFSTTATNDTSHNDNRVTPDARMFTTVLDGYGRAAQQRKFPNSGEKAEALLGIMWDMYYRNPTTLQSIRPDVICYHAVMRAHVASSDHFNDNVGTKVERIFQELLDKQQEFPKDASLAPNIQIYLSLIHAWAQCGEVDRAATILGSMCEAYQGGEPNAPEPDVYCFNAVLHGYAQSENIIAGNEANRLLQKMWELDGQFSNVQPTHVSYSSVMNAWSKSGHVDAGREAEALLLEMWEHVQNGNSHLKPTSTILSNVIRAWGMTDTDDSYRRAKHVFSELHKCPREPTVTVERGVNAYNALLDALWHSSEKEKGELADSCLMALQFRQMEPDLITLKLAHKCWHADKQSRGRNKDLEKINYRMSVLKDQIETMEQQPNRENESVLEDE